MESCGSLLASLLRRGVIPLRFGVGKKGIVSWPEARRRAAHRGSTRDENGVAPTEKLCEKGLFQTLLRKRLLGLEL